MSLLSALLRSSDAFVLRFCGKWFLAVRLRTNCSKWWIGMYIQHQSLQILVKSYLE